MEKEQLALRVEMEKLEIEPVKVTKMTSIEENPFSRKRRTRICANSCNVPKKNVKNVLIAKRNNSKKKMLRDPVFKLLHTCCSVRLEDEKSNCKLSSTLINEENSSLTTLINNQLCISENNNQPDITYRSLNDRLDLPGTVTGGVTSSNVSRPTCSQQALNPPCDVTIDELASYFETLVHIPKKMSTMAEMMYI